MAGNPPSGVPPAIFHHHHPMFTPATSSGDASPVASIFSGENSDAQFLSGLLPAVPGESTEKSGGGLRGGVLVTSPESSAFVPTDQGNFDGSMSMIPSRSAEPQAKSNNAKHGCRPASSATALTTAQEGVSVPCTEVVPHLESSPASQFDQKHFPAPVPSDDGYNWRKYGQKQVKGTDYPRSYYKCSHPDCSMKKKVGKSPDGLVIEIVYKGQHNHEPPQQSRRARESAVTLALDVRDANDAESLCLGSGVGGKNGAILTNEIVVTHENTVVIGVIAPSPRSTSTNVKLTSEQIEKVVVDGRGGGTNGKNGALQGDGSCGPVGINEKAPADMHIASLGHSSSLLGNDHYWESSLLGRTDDSGPTTSGRLSGHSDFEDESYAGLRMDIVPVVEANSMHSFASDSTPSTPKTPREPRIVVQSNSEKESLDDGYRWRKYGQKFVKGNPNPRSYYKCTFMGCNVRKHVERASNNSSAVITTYEGKHNHGNPGAKTSSLDSPSTTGSAAKKLKTSRSFPSQQSISKALPGPAGNELHDMAPGPTIDIRGHQESSLVLNSATPKAVTESMNGPNTSTVKAVALPTDGQSDAMVAMTSLSIGQEFADAKSCRRAIKEIAIALRFDFKTVKSNPTCFTAKCSKDGCPWRVHASKLPYGPSFTIRTLKGNHTCGGIDDLSHKQASVDWVASVIEQRLRENPRYKPKEIVQDILQEHGIAISYKQAYRGKERSMENIYGSYEGGYRLLNVYCNQIRTVNRGSVAFVVTDNVEHRFQRLFVAIHASIFGFVNACRPLLGIDGARLKGKYQGVLFSATAVDAEGGLFPLAFGVVDEESNENWMWFLSELRNLLEKHMETIPMLSIFSNRQKGVVEAVTAHFPFAFHGLYLRHLSENLKKKFGNKAIVRLFLNAAYSLTITDFEANMVKIEEISTEAAEWVRQFSPQLWATAYIEGAQFGHLTSNMVEQFNSWVLEARDLPIVQMMEHIHQGLITRFEKRQEQAMSWTSIYVPSIEKRLSETLSYARRCKVYQANEVEFEIVSSQGTHGVHLCDRYCSCRGWQIYGIPCTHAVAALLSCQQDVYQFVNKCFTVENFRKAYSEAIHPVSDKSLWMNNREQSSDPFDVTAGDSEDVIVHPPISRRSSGPSMKKKKED